MKISTYWKYILSEITAQTDTRSVKGGEQSQEIARRILGVLYEQDPQQIATDVGAELSRRVPFNPATQTFSELFLPPSTSGLTFDDVLDNWVIPTAAPASPTAPVQPAPHTMTTNPIKDHSIGDMAQEIANQVTQNLLQLRSEIPIPTCKEQIPSTDNSLINRNLLSAVLASQALQPKEVRLHPKRKRAYFTDSDSDSDSDHNDDE